MSRVYQAIAALTQGRKLKNENMTKSKSLVTLAFGLSSIAALLIVSYLNNSLFMDRLLVISGILSCILLIKTLGRN